MKRAKDELMREKVKALWKCCFNDSEAFTDLYFRLRYKDEINLSLQHEEKVIAALQMLPYSLTYLGKELKAAYISGACTHPTFRRQGKMRELLSLSFHRMVTDQVDISFLIPAEPGLFDYYAHSGYTPVFHNCRSLFVPTPETYLQESWVESTDEYRQENYDYLNRKLKERPCCVQHDETDFRIILADLQLCGGKIYTLQSEGKIGALAVVYPTETNELLVGEIVSDSEGLKRELLQSICRERSLTSLHYLTLPSSYKASHPLGMARIIRAKEVLQIYATAHPHLEKNIYLIDEQLPINTGYYCFKQGNCSFSTQQPSCIQEKLTIGELTESIFTPLQPYMSLMMNE